MGDLERRRENFLSTDCHFVLPNRCQAVSHANTTREAAFGEVRGLGASAWQQSEMKRKERSKFLVCMCEVYLKLCTKVVTDYVDLLGQELN